MDVESMDLGQLLDYCQCNKVMTHNANDFEGCNFAYHSLCVSHGHFAAQCNSHDTGNTVRVYIVGVGAPYLIINGTYWTRPGYSHNPFYHERGAWDKDFSMFVSLIMSEVKSHHEKAKEKLADAKAKEKNEKEIRKSEVEMFFVGGSNERD